ncbi:MAG: hypothetical protein JXN10_09870, partial [Clostridia bacterium]|nr:hypothetical protein [Clostridia bacterium]
KKFNRLGLLNVIKRVQGEAIDIRNLISNEYINELSDSKIEKVTENYHEIEKKFLEINEVLEKKNGE